MALVNFKALADKEELDFYSKIYRYVFHDINSLMLLIEDIWCSNGDIHCIVCGKTTSSKNILWWGNDELTSDGSPFGSPLLTQMRVLVPKIMLFDIMDGTSPTYGIKVPKDERGDVFRIEIAKAIYLFVMKYRKLIIRLDYDGKLLLKVDSPEEFMINLDLMG